MTLVKWNPAGNAFHCRENYLDDFLKSDRFFAPSRDIWYPAVDVTEDDDAYHVQMELPGLAKEDVKISFKDDVLLVSGEKKSEQKDEKKNYHYYERRYGKFQRAFRINSDVIVDKIDAGFKDGVLMIDLPKAEIAKPKEIEVKVK
ncbi:MAG: Hsp20/alpha crystallin family protein [Calditrichia bacterium]|nr:Hsp20/alpha crystallin family protein [Calditrichia bacterium]